MACRRLVWVAWVVLVVAARVPAYGQAPAAPRPLFGGGAGSTTQSLTVGLTAGHGLFRTEGVRADATTETVLRENSLSFLAASLAYSLAGQRAGLSANVDSTGRYFSELSREIIDGHSGAATAWLDLSSRTRLTAGYSVTNRPAFQVNLSGLINASLLFRPELPVGESVADDRVLLRGTSIDLRQQLTRRASLDLSYTRTERDFSTRDATQASENSGVRYTHQLGAGLSMRLGYRYGTNRLVDEAGVERTNDYHGIDAGVDFSRALSLSRRTTLAFGTGTAVTKRAARTRAHLTGDATLTYQIGRTWQTAISAGRNVGFVDGLGEAVVMDRAAFTVGGQISPRVQIGADASALRGDRGGGERVYAAHGGGLHLGIAVASRVRLGAGYAYRQNAYESEAFLVAPNLRKSSQVYTGVSLGPFRYVTFGVNYAYAVLERDLPGAASGTFNRHSLVATTGVALPLYAQSRRLNASR